MLYVENLIKSYGERLLLDGVGFKLNPRERIGLVGRNGHGKTTLLRMIAGEEPPDAGDIVIPRNYRLAYVRQELAFTKPTTLEEVAAGLPANEQGHLWKVEKVLAGLGFTGADLQRPPSEFSGGYQVRLNLARALVSEPDLLLLDEPTNYLDITSIRWVRRYLQSWPRELMLITHDRSFMDAVVTHTLGIHRKKLRKIAGNTEKYYAQVAQDEEVYEKTRLNDERKRREIEQFISRFRAKARLANLVQSRIKTLEKLQKSEKLQAIRTLDFAFRSKPFPGKHMMTASGLTFGYDAEHRLIDDFSLTLAAGDRICVTGPNGRGKTTLLRLLAGSIPPWQGSIQYNPNVTIGFFEQTNVAGLVDARSVEEEILYAAPDVDRQTARNICGAMLFEGDEALKKVAVLSGGEKSRVMLGKLLVTPVNLLLLDEPTNHLDMDSCDALLAAIDSFEGTVIMVTHNEMFLHALARRLVVFHEDGIELFEGSYQRFLEKNGWHDLPEAGSKSPEYKERPERTSRKEIRRRRSEILAARSRLLKPLEKRMSGLEDAIDAREKDLHQMEKAMQSATETRDGERIAALSRDLHECRQEIDRLFDELERVTEEHDRHKAEFGLKLADFEENLD
jgi:ATP-binding cassette subfamily F protein 3